MRFLNLIQLFIRLSSNVSCVDCIKLTAWLLVFFVCFVVVFCIFPRVEHASIFPRATVQRGLSPSLDLQTPSLRLLLWLPTNLRRYDESPELLTLHVCLLVCGTFFKSLVNEAWSIWSLANIVFFLCIFPRSRVTSDHATNGKCLFLFFSFDNLHQLYVYQLIFHVATKAIKHHECFGSHIPAT